MSLPIEAVIDTNVLVSSLLTSNPESSTVKILDYILNQKLIPLYNEPIIKEYQEVLNRKKFNFDEKDVAKIINKFLDNEIKVEPTPYPHDLPDPKDRVFYEVSLTGDSYLVTGNLKHFPITIKVVTPAQMVAIIEAQIQQT